MKRREIISFLTVGGIGAALGVAVGKATSQSPEVLLRRGRVPIRVQTRTEMLSLNCANLPIGSVIDVAGRVSAGDGYEGRFYLKTGDFSSLISSDPLGGMYAEASGRDNTVAALVRENESDIVLTNWFGDTEQAVIYAMALSNGKKITAKQGSVIAWESEITAPANDDLNIDFRPATISRGVAFTASENLLKGGTGTGKVIINAGKIEDPVGVKGVALFNFAERPLCVINSVDAESHGQLFRIFGCEYALAAGNRLLSDEVSPASGALMGEIKNCANVKVFRNYQKGGRNFIKVETINDGGLTQGVDISYNEIEDTHDTAIFCRMTGIDNNIHELATISFNKLYNIGKAGIKYTAPSTAGDGTIANGLITGNLIKGFGMVVGSPAIIAGNLGLNAGIAVGNVSVIGNIADGRNKSGNISTLMAGDASDNRGFRVVGVTDIVFSNNQARNTPSDGIAIFNCINIMGGGNIVRGACQRSGAGDAGVHFISTFGGNLEVAVEGTVNGGDGVLINKSKDLTITGSSNSNAGYGINELNDGSSGEKAARNVYSMRLTGNTSGPINQAGDSGVNSSQQVNCWDDDKSRIRGSSLRRDEISASWGGGDHAVGGVNRNQGYQFFNTDDDTLEIYKGDVWVKADGTAAAAA